MSLYKAYQMIGGTEDWKTVKAETDFDKIRPTFITALACDTLITDKSPKEMIDNAKYFGPMYFDLDSADDVESAIAGGQALWQKLQLSDLTEDDVEIYLSGKKGLHFIVPPEVFMEKQVPINRLPNMYKELAFKLAVDTLDFSVYSARRGRMLRTHYNQRDNGKYKVQITVKELMALDEAGYDALASSARPRLVQKPEYRSAFAIMFEEVRQRVAATKKVRRKPVTPEMIRKHLPTIKQLMKGESVKDGAGFNKIAIQLAIYAHEAKISADTLVSECVGLIRNHASDSYRYNTATKRERELRRMYEYLDENSGYEFSIGAIESLLESADADSNEESGVDGEVDNSGIFQRGDHYWATSEMGDRHIMDARFKDTLILRNPDNEEISLISTRLVINGVTTSALNCERDAFSSSGGLHRIVSSKGASFTGSDIHARYIYSLMLKEAKLQGRVVYATTCEGLDVLSMPLSTIEDARKPFVTWTDATGVILPESLKNQGLDVRFAPDPGPEGLVKTDLIKAPNWATWVKGDPTNRKVMEEMVLGLVGCQEAGSVAKLLGWMVSCFYTQLFRRNYKQFPLLHVAGPAGTGKTKMVENLMQLFYYEEMPVIQSASGSSVFSVTAFLNGSASIPLILDEYKPHTMPTNKLEDLRSIFRSNYNGQHITRGGGNRNSNSYRALSAIKLIGPISFVAEAMETEPAILHRSVVISLRRPPGFLGAKYTPKWEMFCDNKKALSIVGAYLAADIISNFSLERHRDEFEPIWMAAKKRFLIRSDTDLDSLSDAERVIREGTNDRVVFNYAVVEYGLLKFKQAIHQFFGSEITEELAASLDRISGAVYSDMERVVVNSAPEYIKVLQSFSDMSRFPVDHPNKLANGHDFELTNIGDKNVLNIAIRYAYGKYRGHQRNIGLAPLYAGELSFVQSMIDSPLFIKKGTGTRGLSMDTIYLDYDAMVRQGVYAFHAK